MSFDPNVRKNKAQILYKYLPDADFKIFALLDKSPGLVIDAGANRGHCAIAVLAFTKHLSVYSFEPNLAMIKPLAYIKKRFPKRFDFKLSGLGKICETRNLHIPLGIRPEVSASASFRRSEFQKDYVQERLEGETGQKFGNVEFNSQQAEIRPLDDFRLKPLAIKIDVEGLEKEVLEGAVDTISKHRPMLLIERNNSEEFLPLLEALDYRFYRFDPDQQTLTPLDDSVWCLNAICLHQDSTAYSCLSGIIHM